MVVCFVISLIFGILTILASIFGRDFRDEQLGMPVVGFVLGVVLFFLPVVNIVAMIAAFSWYLMLVDHFRLPAWFKKRLW